DRRNVVLRAIASAEGRSGYVLGSHLNFDPAIDPQETILLAREQGDLDLEEPFRKFARLRLPSAEFTRVWSPSPNEPAHVDESQTPSLGVQVYEEYTMFAHFLLLYRMLRGAKHLQISMDQEHAIRGACLAAFHERVKADSLDAFFVRIRKEITIDQRKALLARSEAMLQQHSKSNAGLSRHALV